MSKIFISYRRDDAEEAAGRLSDHLVSQFGSENIFMDVDGISPGQDFRKAIDEILTKCDVLLAVVGKNWLDCKDEAGNRRLDDPRDFVRLEIANALKRDIPVIPVRVQGAYLPKADQLPDELKDFVFRNAFELTHERWNSDVHLLTEKLRRYMTDPDMNLINGTGVQGTYQPAPPPPPIQRAWIPPSARPNAPFAPLLLPEKKKPIKKIIRWVLVVFCLLGALGSIDDGEAATTLFFIAAVVFFVWDPLKWLSEKRGSGVIGTVPGSNARYT
jgi:hypothetical protein